MKKEKRINKNTQNPKSKIRLGIEILSIGILLLFGASNVGFAQNVGINQPNPDNSAVLDLTSTERGLLIPRMTTTQRDAIDLTGTPHSVLIFNTTVNCFQAYNTNDIQWENIYCFEDCNPVITAHPSNSTICEGESTSFTVMATGSSLTYQWQVDNGGGWSNIIAAGSNPTYANWTTATLSVNSVVAANDGHQYRCFVSGACAPDATSNAATLTVNTAPAAPTAGTHVPGEEQIQWNWNTVSDATGYAYNTSDDYSTATDNGTSTSYTQTGLTCETAYTLYVWAYNDCGESSSVAFTETTSDCLFTCGTSTVDDYDGNTYNTVEIGSQCWIKENMATTHYADGTPLVDGTGAGDISGDYTTKYMFDYNDTPANTTTYGKLYTWAGAMNGASSCNGTDCSTNAECSTPVQGICPDGWHIPSYHEWTVLENYVEVNWGSGSNEFPCDESTTGWLGTNAGGDLKEAGTTHWSSETCGDALCNESGFTALPGGFRGTVGSFSSLTNQGYWWSATEYSSANGCNRRLYYNSSTVDRGANSVAFGFSVRCVRD